jgi:hypothetical protein
MVVVITWIGITTSAKSMQYIYKSINLVVEFHNMINVPNHNSFMHYILQRFQVYYTWFDNWKMFGLCYES